MIDSPPRSLPRGLEPWRRAAGWGFVLLVLAKVLFLAPLLLYRRLEWSYPFLGGDGAEWLSQGLAMFGADVRSTGRQPLLPLLAGLLDRCHALRYLPWVPLGAAATLELLLFFRLRRLYGLAVAWGCGLYLLVHHGLLEGSVQLMADLLATLLLTLAVLALVDSGRPPARGGRFWAVGCGASAVLAQQAALVPLAALLLGTALRERPRGGGWRLGREESRCALLLAGIALPNVLWQLWLRRGAGAGAVVPRAQWDYLRPHLAALDDSAALALAFFGLPALGLVLWEMARLARRGLPADAERSRWTFAALTWILASGLFFALLYDYRASRFFLYVLPPFVLLLGQRLAALRPRPFLFAGAALAAIWGGAWTQGLGAARTGLWPLPPVELVVGVEGEEDPPLRPRLEQTSYSEVLRRSLPERALRAWREKGDESPPSISGLASIRRVVALYPEETPAGQRYELRDRLGNTLRRRTKLAPCGLFPRHWKGWGELREVERSGDLRFLRGRNGAEESPWLLVAPEGCLPRASRVARDAHSTPLVDPALAAEIERRLSDPDEFVAVVAAGEGGRAAARALALTLRTPNFFVLDRAVADALPRLAEGEERIGPYRVLRVRYRRWPVFLLEPASAP